MPNNEMAKEWLKAAKTDLEVIKNILHDEHLTSMVAFHSQQSIEKSLKAILEYYNQDVPKIHQIKKLFYLTKDYVEFDIDKELVLKIDTLYIESRYPGSLGLLPYGKPTLKDAKEFFLFATNIFNTVCNQLQIKLNTKANS